MSAPGVIWHISWWESFRDRTEERRYRSPQRAARQVLAILSAPDDVVALRELAQTDGWERDSLSWRTLDPREFVVAVLGDEEPDEFGDTILTQYERIEAAWSAHQRPRAGAGDLHAHAGSSTGTDDLAGQHARRPTSAASPLGTHLPLSRGAPSER